MLNWVTLKFYKTISTYKSFLKLKKVIVIALKAYLSDLAIYIASVTFFYEIEFWHNALQVTGRTSQRK